MASPPQAGLLFLLATYTLLSAVPFVPALLGQPPEHPRQLLAVAALSWLAAWALFQRPAYFHWLLLPAFLALPAELYLRTRYGLGISTHHLGIIAESSPGEALEFLGEKIWGMTAVMLAMLGWWLLTWRIARQRRELDWRHSSRYVALFALTLPGCAWLYSYAVDVARPPSESGSASTSSPAGAVGANGSSAAAPSRRRRDWSAPALPDWAALPLSLPALGSSWPLGLTTRGVDFYRERKYLGKLGESGRHFLFGARQASPDRAPEVVVLVLGESSRYDRWSLNGYARGTTPLLSQEDNLIALSDVITPVSATRRSVPVIISRKPATRSLKDGFAEKSFLSAYREAGFKTYWLSNQISFGPFDTPVSVFAKEADVLQFLNLGGVTEQSNFDEVLLGPLRRALDDPAPKKLIVLHSLGSHWNYGQRYPKRFDRWQPSLFGARAPAHTDAALKPQINNSYDNSILYTDWFLARAIDAIKASGHIGSLLYVADHGQALHDGSCKLALHGHNTQFDFHVPAFVWYSDQYRERYPDKVAQLIRHRNARLSTENMFHTLLDLGDIRYATERLEWSFVNRQFRRHQRYVDSYGWADYDNATFKGDCREVIDKQKPLPR